MWEVGVILSLLLIYIINWYLSHISIPCFVCSLVYEDSLGDVLPQEHWKGQAWTLRFL